MARKYRIPLSRFAYGALIFGAITVGTAPALLTYMVDPFEFFRGGEHDKRRNEKTEKKHYPLWKFAHYRQNAEIVVLGDSRARALRDKYWHEFGAEQTFNFAYGGGTIPEIYSTFQAIKDDPQLKKLVVGVQLRSFDENHKDGLNRVPEAHKATASSLSYMKNWFVARRSWELFSQDNPRLVRVVTGLVPAVMTEAKAADLGAIGRTDVATLLQPDVCFGCELPKVTDAIAEPPSKGPNLGLGRGSSRFMINSKVILPEKFERQVRKNASSDWKQFRFSERYFKMIEDIARWGDEREDRQVTFVIPPTIVDMQNTIDAFGLTSLNKSFRQRLAALGTLIDLDFSNPLTKNIENFTDAYHFNARTARAIVGEIISVQGATEKQIKLVQKRRGILFCVTNPSVEPFETQTAFTEGRSCRVWEDKQDG